MDSESLKPSDHWALDLKIQITHAGQFVNTDMWLLKLGQIGPIRVSYTMSKDMLYERLQGELNNALRQLVNDIQRELNVPNQTKQTRR